MLLSSDRWRARSSRGGLDYENTGYDTRGMGYDFVEKLNDRQMALRGVHDEEPVTYERLATMP